ncbi:hypothetical protein EH164_11100 [Kosakonia sp. CCTCC M2018092]|uniref:acyltransferase family protein n=1 Tax=Kosakonia sp. CCTCC M2018092 TaxID=2492396 RepID=UPI000F60A805|nr:acyltransferase family protein [Kosakonia sp. CCTCC M2018092]AZI87568.1 hypothetical protein EH164_11100 [Kosakonia sp. CCTCC M2018092]
MKSRDIHIDFLKALATLLVIIGHSVQFADKNFDNNWIFKIIYSFHMPLFMCISGYLYSKKESSVKSILNKAKVLLVPFYAWGIISLLYYSWDGVTLAAVVNTIRQITFDPGQGLWFLWALFICFLIFYILPEKGKEFYAFAFIIILNQLQSTIPSMAYFGMNLVSWQFPFFLIGLIIKKYNLINIFRNKIIFCMALLTYILAASQWHRLSITELFGSPLDIERQYDTLNIIRYTAAISAFIVLFGLKINIRKALIVDAIVFLSKNSLSYYAMQVLILSVLIGKLHEYFSNNYAIEAIAVSIALFIITISIYFINRLPAVRIVLFGR